MSPAHVLCSLRWLVAFCLTRNLWLIDVLFERDLFALFCRRRRRLCCLLPHFATFLEARIALSFLLTC